MLRIKSLIPRIAVLLAVLLIVAGLLPGDLTPAGALKSIADRFVADGDFEPLTPGFYNRIRPVFLGGGTVLLAAGLLLGRAMQIENTARVRRIIRITAVAGLDEIFALGLRNPWRFSFDALTGDLYVADVGHKMFEEVNFVPTGSPPGINFGWNHYEGFDFYVEYSPPPVPALPDHTPPVWVYPHGGGRCAIVGGHVYRGSAIPSLAGKYVYGDHCTGDIWALHRDGSGIWVNEYLFDTRHTITSFGVDAQNELYHLDFQGGLYRLEP